MSPEMKLKFDWHFSDHTEKPFACVFIADADGIEEERVADFYGAACAERAEEYASILNARAAKARAAILAELEGR